MIQENKPVYNSGLSECFVGIYKKLPILEASPKDVHERMKKFQEEIDGKIIRKEFDLILLTTDYYSFLSKKTC